MLLVAVAATGLAAGCTLIFDRGFVPGRDGGAVGRDTGTNVDAGAACDGADDGAPCPAGRCFEGACCGGCITLGGCAPGTDNDACGSAGAVCQLCPTSAPSCVGQICRADHPAVEVVVGLGHACARDAEGRVYCWGRDLAGELGARPAGGACSSGEVPLEVPLLEPAASLTSHHRSTCALGESGVAYCWGGGHVGGGSPSAPSTCVDGSTSAPREEPASLDPVEVMPPALPLTWRQVATAEDVIFGLHEDGRLAYWGAWGATPTPAPAWVSGAGAGERFARIVASNHAVVAITDDGRAFSVTSETTGLPNEPALEGAVVAVGEGHLRRCLAFDSGRIECVGPYAPRRNAAFVATAAGFGITRPDAGAVVSLTVSAGEGFTFAYWINEAGELWSVTDSSDAAPARRTLPDVDRFVRVASGRNGGVAAIDAFGRVWRWHTTSFARAVQIRLP